MYEWFYFIIDFIAIDMSECDVNYGILIYMYIFLINYQKKKNATFFLFFTLKLDLF